MSQLTRLWQYSLLLQLRKRLIECVPGIFIPRPAQFSCLAHTHDTRVIPTEQECQKPPGGFIPSLLVQTMLVPQIFPRFHHLRPLRPLGRIDLLMDDAMLVLAKLVLETNRLGNSTHRHGRG